jgi:Fe2+ transport system protein FeoA
MHCGMCGYDFDPSELACHASCPLGAACMVVCCPRCGYSTVDPQRSSLSRRLLHLFDRNSPAAATGGPEGTVRLLDLKPGQGGHVCDVGGGGSRLAHLSQYGLLPGTPIRLTQKRPVPIVQVGQTDLALDMAIAAEIYVDVH